MGRGGQRWAWKAGYFEGQRISSACDQKPALLRRYRGNLMEKGLVVELPNYGGGDQRGPELKDKHKDPRGGQPKVKPPFWRVWVGPTRDPERNHYLTKDYTLCMGKPSSAECTSIPWRHTTLRLAAGPAGGALSSPPPRVCKPRNHSSDCNVLCTAWPSSCARISRSADVTSHLRASRESACACA